ncbi:hypothetical protein MPSI1_003732 [Malassezia psittaci]|uniref:Uncharacterized protein n=1 Tax=Malassezia psittaci TaxID=1821823 RepID=A0AAF0FA16_9BASI|nr:hypothetical protein MPSI1_003732 [Malassezia psittaci]
MKTEASGGVRAKVQARNSAIAGASAGFVSSIVTCPLDVIKTRLQVGTASRSHSGVRNVAHIVAQIWHDDGLRGYYRGLVPTMVGYLPTWAIYFVVYDKGKNVYARLFHRPNSSRDHNTGTHEFLTHTCSALTAGIVSTVCTSPLWVVKTRTMLQTSKQPIDSRYRNILDAFRKIYSKEGLGGFYKGLLPSLLGVFHVVVQFPLYEYFKSIAANRQHSDSLSTSSILLCSGGSKMLASIATYPHEVLRTRLQMVPQSDRTQYTGLIRAVKYIYHHEGPKGFYRGMGVNLIRTVPNSGLTLLTYEMIMRHLDPLHSSP